QRLTGAGLGRGRTSRVTWWRGVSVGPGPIAVTDIPRASNALDAARVTVNSAEADIARRLAGLGLILIPADDMRDHIAAGEWVEVMPDHRAAPAPLTPLYPHRRHLSRRISVFIAWLEPLLRDAIRR
ncbi:LysR substrate-binding domain-containing protein, partial [Methylopila musalis]